MPTSLPNLSIHSDPPEQASRTVGGGHGECLRDPHPRYLPKIGMKTLIKGLITAKFDA
jgi:hypothetical protein